MPIPLTMPPSSGLPGKRLATSSHPAESPAKKKQSKWSVEEDAAIIELRGNGMKWEDISKNLPGRSAISCRLRFQNYLERRSEWDEEKKNKLARLYERFKKDMWEKIAKEMALPWRAAEAMHWQIGEVEMANRANVPVFHLAGQQSSSSSAAPSAASVTTSASAVTDAQATSASPVSAGSSGPAQLQSVDQRDFTHDVRALSPAGFYGRSSDAPASGGDEGNQEDGLAQHRVGELRASEQPSGPPGQRQYLSPFGRPSDGSIR